MACWPANSVGAFFLALLIYDLIRGDYAGLPYHAGVGILLTILFWVICMFIGETVSGAILFVPATFLLVFLFTMWLVGRSFQNKVCSPPQTTVCKPNRWYLKPRSEECAPPKPVPTTPPTTTPSTTGSCVNSNLKATPLQ